MRQEHTSILLVSDIFFLVHSPAGTAAGTAAAGAAAGAGFDH